MTGDLQLVLNLKSNSSSNPMTAPALTITMTDLESMADPDLYDMTTVYENPNIMFVSYDDDWFTGKETAKMDEGTAHPSLNWAVSGSLIMLLSSIKIQHREIIKN